MLGYEEVFTFKNILIYLVIINLIGFFVMGIDKRRAIKNQWRIPEKTIFVLTALGGGIGTILGILLDIRHKKCLL